LSLSPSLSLSLPLSLSPSLSLTLSLSPTLSLSLSLSPHPLCLDQDREGDDDTELTEDELSNIIEIYDFPTEFKTEDLVKSFQAYQYVPAFTVFLRVLRFSHTLVPINTQQRSALRTKHPLLKVRSLAKASVTTRAKARSCSDYLLPTKERPQTSAVLARRLVMGALGVKSPQSKEHREAERKKLQDARGTRFQGAV
uniref:R3H domain and coiled-coil containing 1-like n=1 Tax=Oncorhynchus tshawytscha TaxID=74940 RepID=A0AAZ3RWZ9_ONCTS